MTFEGTPRPNLFRDGVKEILKGDSWPTEIKKLVKNVPNGEGSINSVQDVLSEVAIKLNNLGFNGLRPDNYLAMREIVDVVLIDCPAYSGTADEEVLVFVPLLWLDRLKSVDGLLNEPGAGVIKGGVVKYVGGIFPEVGKWLENESNKPLIDKKIKEWVATNTPFLIPSEGFFEEQTTKKDEATI